MRRSLSPSGMLKKSILPGVNFKSREEMLFAGFPQGRPGLRKRPFNRSLALEDFGTLVASLDTMVFCCV